MNLKAYRVFVNAFEDLSPYALEHFSKLFYTSYRDLNSLIGNIRMLNHSELQELLIIVMRQAHIEITEKIISEEKVNLELLKSELLVEDTVD